MKKLLSILAVLSLLLFLSCDDDNNDTPENPKTPKLTKYVSTTVYVDGRKNENTITVSYGENGYISDVISTGVKYKTTSVYFYNSDNQLVKNEWKEIDLEKNTTTGSDVTNYTYNDKGQIISEEQIESDGERYLSMFEYNSKGLMIKETEKYEIINYVYDLDNKLSKSYTEDSKGYTIYKFDDEKSPYATMFPEAFMRISVGDGLFVNNILLEDEKNERGESQYKMTYEYTFNDKGYPTRIITKRYYNEDLKSTETSDLVYE